MVTWRCNFFFFFFWGGGGGGDEIYDLGTFWSKTSLASVFLGSSILSFVLLLFVCPLIFPRFFYGSKIPHENKRMQILKLSMGVYLI